MADVRDFLDFLGTHKGDVVKVELGIRADDLKQHDRPMGKLYGVLGAVRMVDDEDRAERGVAWVPIGQQDSGSVGFWVESERASEVVVSARGGKVRFLDSHYVAVATLGR